MSFLREFAATEAPARAPLTLRWLNERPRDLFAELHAEQPIFVTPGFVLVTRYADVFEVLSRGDVFLAHALESRRQPLVGGFSLDEREGPRPALEAGVVRLCIRPDDADLVARLAREAAELAVTGGRERGGLDIVHDLAHHVAGRIAADYLGIGGPDETTLGRWVIAIGRDVDDNPTGDAHVHDRARLAVAELSGYADAITINRRSRLAVRGNPGDDVLGRLLALSQVEHLAIEPGRLRELMFGMLLALVDPIAAGISLAITELLDRPGALGAARELAAADDDPGLWTLLREALRFNPPRPVVPRVCSDAYILAKGTANELRLKPGTVVLAATAAAAFDPERVDDPEHFRLGRPEHHDFLFGHGIHACIGRRLGVVAIREGCKALLKAGDFHPLTALRRDGWRPIAQPVEFP
jgi:cytochrome P450